MDTNCDFSPLKLELKDRLQGLIGKMAKTSEGLDQETHCLLHDFEEITDELHLIQSLAAAFYLKCYLSSYTSKYTEISLSVRHLADRRHGALIAVERKHPLDAFITPGIPVDAALTPHLLESIFVPGSPLHDGAVLIRGDKIVSASNVLPLSQLVTDQKLGTRHRAAIGLSEITDALVIVVSEETGRSSFCIGGKIYAFSALP